MFVDTAQITVKAGRGGDGAVSFRHEKWVDRGGPDGGDGGRGGDVVIRAEQQLNTLQTFRHKKEFKAKPGQPGSKQKQRGRSAEDLVIEVPVGIVVTDAGSGELIADLDQSDQMVVAASGGRGGFGNAHFVNSRRQAPKFAELGDIGEELDIDLELKLLADIGLAGLPNAGKSTFIAAVTNAKPKIADYAFTTLVPNLGIADIDGESLLIADIPGLIEGAHTGKGLGDEFLRHIDRTKAIAHLVDYYSDDLIADIRTIRSELKQHNPSLLDKPQVLIITKTEGVDSTDTQTAIDLVRSELEDCYADILPISSLAQTNLDAALRALIRARNSYVPPQTELQSEIAVIRHQDDQEWTIEIIESNSSKQYIIHSPQIERFARQTDFGNPQAADRFTDILRKKGVLKDLSRKGWTFDLDVTVAGKQISLV